MNRVIGIKVDVDTSEGLKHGVPRLLSVFAKHGVPASFFVPTGKDHTGWTAKRVFTRKGFLKKAGRVGVVSTYGIKTLMYGLLLPGPEFAKKNKDLLKAVTEDGHDLGIHGHDHVCWHDHIKGWGRERTEEELKRSFSVFRECTGREPDSFAAPGWMVNSHSLRFFAERGLLFTSNTRGTTPFFPRMGEETFKVLEIPTTLPTLDEVVGVAGTEVPTLSRFYVESLGDGLQILTVHTELEGNRWTGFLEDFLEKSIAMGFTFRRLSDIARQVASEGEAVPVSEVVYGFVEGRAGEVCKQQIPNLQRNP